MREEAADLVATHVGGMAEVVEEDASLDPVNVGVLGTRAVMADANGSPDPIEQSGLPG